MAPFADGPASSLFTPLPIDGNTSYPRLARRDDLHGFGEPAAAPSGDGVAWGIPFSVNRPLLLAGKSVTVRFEPVRASHVVFMHTSGIEPPQPDADGLLRLPDGPGRLGEHAADYVLLYADGQEARHTIRRRFQVGLVQRGWGENCVEAVAHRKPFPVRNTTDQPGLRLPWGFSQTRTAQADMGPWVSWLWAWANPRPREKVVGIRFEPVSGALVVSGVTAGRVSSNPLRWQRRRKALVRLPRGTAFDPTLDDRGLSRHVRLDLGQVISVEPQPRYPAADWAKSDPNAVPDADSRTVLVEYTAHDDAAFHLESGRPVPVRRAESGGAPGVEPVAPAHQRVRLRVVEKGSKRPVPVKLHLHGEAGEYLAPVDRHRYPNPNWFEDYAPEFVHQRRYPCTYIDGETTVDLPLGRVYVEVTKGFEMRPVRKAIDVKPRTRQVTLTVERVLPWRERGWVTADTHVHFLSPPTAGLEGAAEGVNVVNLLASQWGELMTNAGDFDGKTTYGSREAGGDGEHLVRVGTENRQHVLGHISLVGYDGPPIVPMTTGGPDEAALGAPVDTLLLDWARQCRAQNGIVVMPHWPNPRLENAAVLLEGLADAVEVTSWGDLYSGINPYSLTDWYRFLNCGYFVPAVAGTDKMSADTPVGAVRTYARIADGEPFTYESWKAAIRSGHTFVSYGPLLELQVEGRPPGSRIEMGAGGGAVAVEWELACATMDMTRVDLIVNGEVRESREVKARADRGHWDLRLDRSAWLALLVRGRYRASRELIAAHSSPVMVAVGDSPFFAAADALTILTQVEGALAWLDTVATPADAAAMKRMRMALTSAYRRLHNRLHEAGHDHRHSPATDHEEHHH
jgi:hypothetical protein